MQNETSIHQCFSVVSVSAGVEYRFLNTGRFSFLFGGGLGANYVAGLDQDMNTKLYIDDVMMMNHDYSVSADRDINRAYLSVYGDVGVQYAVSDRVYLGLDLAYDRSVTSIRKSSAGDVRTFLNGFQSGLAIGVKF